MRSHATGLQPPVSPTVNSTASTPSKAPGADARNVAVKWPGVSPVGSATKETVPGAVVDTGARSQGASLVNVTAVPGTWDASCTLPVAGTPFWSAVKAIDAPLQV